MHLVSIRLGSRTWAGEGWAESLWEHQWAQIWEAREGRPWENEEGVNRKEKKKTSQMFNLLTYASLSPRDFWIRHPIPSLEGARWVEEEPPELRWALCRAKRSQRTGTASSAMLETWRSGQERSLLHSESSDKVAWGKRRSQNKKGEGRRNRLRIQESQDWGKSQKDKLEMFWINSGHQSQSLQWYSMEPDRMDSILLGHTQPVGRNGLATKILVSEKWRE